MKSFHINRHIFIIDGVVALLLQVEHRLRGGSCAVGLVVEGDCRVAVVVGWRSARHDARARGNGGGLVVVSHYLHLAGNGEGDGRHNPLGDTAVVQCGKAIALAAHATGAAAEHGGVDLGYVGRGNTAVAVGIARDVAVFQQVSIDLSDIGSSDNAVAVHVEQAGAQGFGVDIDKGLKLVGERGIGLGAAGVDAQQCAAWHVLQHHGGIGHVTEDAFHGIAARECIVANALQR